MLLIRLFSFINFTKYIRSVHEPDEPQMDGDTAYTTRRKSLRMSWTLLTSTFAFIVLLCALCLFFFFHPRTCHPNMFGATFGSTETILNEIRGVDYETTMENNGDSTDVRLPTVVVPESYNLRIIPFLWAGNSTFDGQVDIIVNVTAPVDNITLHAVGLNMTECLVTRYIKTFS